MLHFANLSLGLASGDRTMELLNKNLFVLCKSLFSLSRCGAEIFNFVYGTAPLFFLFWLLLQPYTGTVPTYGYCHLKIGNIFFDDIETVLYE